MTYEESYNFAETMFKRLWQNGYRGRFAAFRWPTFYAPDPLAPAAKYNESEYRAWYSGHALKQFVDALAPGYSRSITAHSMGNVVTGSALKQGMSINRYVLLQAAIPASVTGSTLDP
jgi:esterase/lipase superfamily enzyme